MQTVQLHKLSEGQVGELLGRKHLEHLLEEARKYAPISIRPSRESANMLYRSLGFVKRDTNVYKLELK